MKILFIGSYYQRYLDCLHKKNPHLSSLSYQEQLDYMLSDYTGWHLSLVNQLENMGCEIRIITVNVMSVQKAWAVENNFIFESEKWDYEISIEQIKQFNPDIIWIVGSSRYHDKEYLKELRKYCNKMFVWIAVTVSSSLDLSNIDCIITSHQNFQKYFQSQGKKCERLLPAFQADILKRINKQTKDINCSFVGSLSYFHLQRMEMIKQLVDRTSLQIWSDPPKFLSRGILNPKFVVSYLKMSTVRARINPSVWGLEMYQTLARSRMTVNIHVDAASGLAGNMRMFEATGSGTLLITEDAPNIQELFQPETEVVTYNSTADLIDKINYYSEHSAECEAISHAGQKRTLTAHSSAVRSKELLDLFDRYLRS
jgi:spore maturation protein CgeB